MRNQSHDVTSIFQQLYDIGWNQNLVEPQVASLSDLQENINVEIDFSNQIGREHDAQPVQATPHSLVAFGKRDCGFLFRYVPANGEIELSRFGTGFGGVGV